MLHKLIKKSFFLFVILLSAGCQSSFQVQTQSFRAVDFDTLNSFKFFNPRHLPKANFSFSEENKEIIFDAVAREFKEMGYSSHQNADLLVKIQGGTIAERELQDRYPASPYFGGGYYPYPSFNDYYSDISRKTTTLIIDVLNAETNRILWQGVATGEMGKKPEEVELKLKEAIQSIFEEFPANKATEESADQ